MTEETKRIEAKELAIFFHDTYESLATNFGYETRTETRKFDPDSANGKLVIAVCEKVSEKYLRSEQVIAELKNYKIWHDAMIGHPVTFHKCSNGDIKQYPKVLCSMCRNGEDFDAVQYLVEKDKEIQELRAKLNEARDISLAWFKSEQVIKGLVSLLEKYNQWEADLISEDKMWWPFHTGDVITGKVYETMMELQAERNELLASYYNSTKLDTPINRNKYEYRKR